jgi:anti-sigma B factor antagonist
MAAVFIVQCKSCGKKLKRRAEMMELQGRCPHCGGVIPAQRKPDTGPRRTVRPQADDRPWDGSLLAVRKEDGVGIVTFAKSHILDQSNVQQLGEELEALVDRQKLRKLVINFKGVTYMSSVVMGKLTALLRKVEEVNGEIRLCGIEDDVYEIFDLLRYDTIFTIYKTEARAVKDLKK